MTQPAGKSAKLPASGKDLSAVFDGYIGYVILYLKKIIRSLRKYSAWHLSAAGPAVALAGRRSGG
jgi:hypothetical protein